MNLRSGTAVMMLLLGSGSLAFGADTRDAPINRLMFPESVERAMMGEAAAANRLNPMREVPPVTELMLMQSDNGLFSFVPTEPNESCIKPICVPRQRLFRTLRCWHRHKRAL